MGRPRLLASHLAPLAFGATRTIEIRASEAPANPHGWLFLWAVVEVTRVPSTNELGQPSGGEEETVRVLDGCGLNGHEGARTLAEALASSATAFAAIRGRH